MIKSLETASVMWLAGNSVPRTSVLKAFIVVADLTARRAALCPKGLFCASAIGAFTINCEIWKDNRTKPALHTSNESCFPFFFQSVE